MIELIGCFGVEPASQARAVRHDIDQHAVATRLLQDEVEAPSSGSPATPESAAFFAVGKVATRLAACRRVRRVEENHFERERGRDHPATHF